MTDETTHTELDDARLAEMETEIIKPTKILMDIRARRAIRRIDRHGYPDPPDAEMLIEAINNKAPETQAAKRRQERLLAAAERVAP